MNWVQRNAVLVVLFAAGPGTMALQSTVAQPTRPANERARRAAFTPEDSTYFLEVPILGQIGLPIQEEGLVDTRKERVAFAVGVEEALRFARENRIQHIVLTIDSPGGLVAEAQAIVDVLQRYDQDFTYHAVVRRAISAAIWVVFASDKIYVRPNALIGGAVAYTVDKVGDAAVSAKMNSIIAARIAAVAQEKGHSAVLVRAMVMKGASAYAYRADDGSVLLTATRLRETRREAMELDSNSTVLTLTGVEAIRYGLAAGNAFNAEEVGRAAGLPRWRRACSYGHVAMTVAQFFRHSQVGEWMGEGGPSCTGIRVSLGAYSPPRRSTTMRVSRLGKRERLRPGQRFPSGRRRVAVRKSRGQIGRERSSKKRAFERRVTPWIRRAESQEPEAFVCRYDAGTGKVYREDAREWLRRRGMARAAWYRLQDEGKRMKARG